MVWSLYHKRQRPWPHNDPDIRYPDRTSLYTPNNVSTFLWGHTKVRSQQINKGSNTNRLPHPNGPCGTHQKSGKENVQEQSSEQFLPQDQEISRGEFNLGDARKIQLWIADQRDTHEKKIVNEPEGLRQFQDHRWKALDEENPDLPGIFFFDHFWPPIFFKQVKTRLQQKYTRNMVHRAGHTTSDIFQRPKLKL